MYTFFILIARFLIDYTQKRNKKARQEICLAGTAKNAFGKRNEPQIFSII